MKTSRNFVTEKMGVAYFARIRQCDASPHVKPGDGSYLCSDWRLNVGSLGHVVTAAALERLDI
jgi:hypothetical protein